MNTQAQICQGWIGAFSPSPVSVLGMGGLPVIVTPDLERALHGGA